MRIFVVVVSNDIWSTLAQFKKHANQSLELIKSKNAPFFYMKTTEEKA